MRTCWHKFQDVTVLNGQAVHTVVN